MAGMTRGPLRAEVYWRRRLLLLGLAFLLVLGVGRVLGAGADGSDGSATPGDPQATAVQAGGAATATPTPDGGTADSATPAPASPSPSTRQQIRRAERAQRRAEQKAAEEAAAAAAAQAAATAAAALPEPQGTCSDTDVVVTPSVPSPVAGGDVAIDLELRTRFSPACSWQVSPDSIALKITSGREDIWRAQDCPTAVPTQDVVLRRAVPTTVQVVWNAKRSDAECTNRTRWALPGFYHVLAAALAGEPTDVQFELTAPPRPQVTRTAEPQTGRNQDQTQSQPPG